MTFSEPLLEGDGQSIVLSSSDVSGITEGLYPINLIFANEDNPGSVRFDSLAICENKFNYLNLYPNPYSQTDFTIVLEIVNYDPNLQLVFEVRETSNLNATTIHEEVLSVSGDCIVETQISVSSEFDPGVYYTTLRYGSEVSSKKVNKLD